MVISIYRKNSLAVLEVRRNITARCAEHYPYKTLNLSYRRTIFCSSSFKNIVYCKISKELNLSRLAFKLCWKVSFACMFICAFMHLMHSTYVLSFFLNRTPMHIYSLNKPFLTKVPWNSKVPLEVARGFLSCGDLSLDGACIVSWHGHLASAAWFLAVCRVVSFSLTTNVRRLEVRCATALKEICVYEVCQHILAGCRGPPSLGLQTHTLKCVVIANLRAKPIINHILQNHLQVHKIDTIFDTLNKNKLNLYKESGVFIFHSPFRIPQGPIRRVPGVKRCLTISMHLQSQITIHHVFQWSLLFPL